MLNTLSFADKFKFDPDFAFAIGVEREFFITDHLGKFAPKAHLILDEIKNPMAGAGSFSYELSACQIESQSVPCFTERDIIKCQKILDAELYQSAASLGLKIKSIEVAPRNLPLETFKDPQNRYQRIATSMSKRRLSAACRVAGTHIHIGMPDKETALRVYNKVIKHNHKLCIVGDKSFGKRLELYQRVTPRYSPIPYSSWQEFEDYASKEGFKQNPRNCWHMIRLTIHGTIEFRNFGATSDLNELTSWAMICKNLCLQYQ